MSPFVAKVLLAFVLNKLHILYKKLMPSVWVLCGGQSHTSKKEPENIVLIGKCLTFLKRL